MFTPSLPPSDLEMHVNQDVGIPGTFALPSVYIKVDMDVDVADEGADVTKYRHHPRHYR
jgi:hypothetical protein